MRNVLLFVFLLLGCAQRASAQYFRFIENKNQWHSSVDFAARVPGGNMNVSAGTFTYTLLDMEKLDAFHEEGHHGFKEVNEVASEPEMIGGHTVQVSMQGANTSAKAE